MRVVRQEPAQNGVLVVMDGGFPAFVAAWMEGVCRAPDGSGTSRGPGAHGWFCHEEGVGARRAGVLKRAARKAATLSALAGLDTGQFAQINAGRAAERAGGEDVGAWRGMDHSILLLNAACEARRLGLARVVWPVHVGGDAPELNAVADVCDRAMLIGQLAGLDSPREGGGEFRIEVPFADLTDVQLAELAIDMDVPVMDLFAPPPEESICGDPACWWCEEDGPTMCGRCASCIRWRRAFEAAAPSMMRDVAEPASRD